MSKDTEFRPKARKPRGLRDQFASDVLARRHALDVIRGVYESYGFEPLETSAFEYADALGKFLPDADRPNAGVFALQDDDEQWLALRYDLTAPLARLAAEHFDALPKPFRRYQFGPVWRNEKPGPGRFREFFQFDVDTVGAATMAADTELCMVLADALEALGIARGDYRVRVNNRKILTGVLETVGADDAHTRLIILRAIDKLDRLGMEGVRLLLGPGREDESGDFTKGANLASEQIARVTGFLGAGDADRAKVCAHLRELVGASATGLDGVAELEEIDALLQAGGYGPDQVVFDPSVVRGLDYYTGPVIEAELTFEVHDESGRKVQFGSVAGGGRYDDLVQRFKGVLVPATGVSIGVDRLLAALRLLHGDKAAPAAKGPVVVLMLDKTRSAEYQAMVGELRRAGIRAELYLGGSGMRAQVKYADKRNAPVAVIAGGDEFAAGQVTLKDLVLGDRLSKDIKDNAAWREDQPAQQLVPREDLVAGVREILAREHHQI
ncbi:MAG: histidine--tRNA ligase [Alphaproteobacteria bacterium]|nr:histidine--tRNA ligase [Alphaproteobacteria bacterium]